jgi:quercetin dioxygenase-like cupin family protein
MIARITKFTLVPIIALLILSTPATAAESAAKEDAIKIIRAGEQASVFGSQNTFAGRVRIDQAFAGQAPAQLGGALVTFDPGARTAWHTHPLGQILIVTSGIGWVQEWEKPIREVRPGDIIWIPPNIKHWHGASSTVGMSHLAMAEKLDGISVSWMEQVSDDQYLGTPILRP